MGDSYRRAKRDQDLLSPDDKRERRRYGSRERNGSMESDQYFTKRDKGSKGSSTHKRRRKASDISPNLKKFDTHHAHTISKESLERLEKENNIKRLHRQSVRTDGSSPRVKTDKNSN